MRLLLTIPWFRAEALVLYDQPVRVGESVLMERVEIHPFGLLVAAGVLIGAMIAERRGRAVGLHPSAVMNLAGWVLIPAFVLAHVVDALAYHPDVVREHPELLLQLWNGLSSFGGFMGAALGALAWQRVNKASILAMADPIAFGFPFGWLFGRTGCFVVHDHPGSVTTFFLGVEDYQVGYPPYQTRHDLGLYEVLWCVAVIGLFLVLARRERVARGLFLGLLPVLYSPVRFGLDFLRAGADEGGDERYFGLTPGHYSAIALLALGAYVLRRALTEPVPVVPAHLLAEPPPDERENKDRSDG